MTYRVKPLGGALRLEIEDDLPPGAHVNLVPNPNGANGLGGWGWLIPYADSNARIEGYPNASGVQSLRWNPDTSVGPQQARPHYFTTDPLSVTPGRYVAAAWDMPAPGYYWTSKYVWHDAEGAEVIGPVQPTVYRGGPGVTGTFAQAPMQVPAGTATVELRFDIFQIPSTGIDGWVTPGQFIFLRHVIVAQEPTAAALTGLAYVEPSFVDVLGVTHDVTVTRENLNVGVLSAHIRDAELDPSQGGIVRPGRALRLLARDDADDTWRAVFTGTTSHAVVTYDLAQPDENKRAEIELSAVDNVQRLANQRRTEGVGTVDQLPVLLIGCGVPWNVNGSGAGTETPYAWTASTNENATALDQVNVTRDTELGLAWVDRTGVLHVVDQAHRSTTSVGTLDEDTFTDVGVSFDSATLINEVTLHYLSFDGDTTEDVVYGPYRDEQSIETWGVWSTDFTVQAIEESEAVLAAYAQQILDANSTPVVRLNTMGLHVDVTDDLAAIPSWYAWLDLYDIVHVSYARARAIDEPVRVVGITHTISGPDSKWQVELVLTGTTRVALPTSSTGGAQTAGGGVPSGGSGPGGGGAPTGPAGGDLAGTYPNPEIAAGKVGTPELADSSVTSAKLVDSSVTSAKIVDGTIVTGDLAPSVLQAARPEVYDEGALVVNDARSLDFRGAGVVATNDGLGDVRVTVSGVPTAHATTHQPGGSDAMAVDAAAATGSLRTLGTGAQQAAAGEHTHAGLTFFPDPTDASDIATYKKLQTSPSAAVESTIVTALAGTSDVLVGVFASDPGVPGAIDYPAGTATRNIYAAVTAGTARLHLMIYKRSAAGVETLLRDELSGDFVNVAVALQQWTITAAAVGTLLATDRLVAKLYAQRVAGPTNISVTTYYEGTAHTSAIGTTIAAGAPIGAAGGDLTGTYPNPTLSPTKDATLLHVAGAETVTGQKTVTAGDGSGVGAPGASLILRADKPILRLENSAIGAAVQLRLNQFGIVDLYNGAGTTASEFRAGALYDNNQRVYSANNPPPSTAPPSLPINEWVKGECRMLYAGTNDPLFGAPSSVDGIPLVVGDRILKATPGGAANNGIYVVSSVGTGSNGGWTRAGDAGTQQQLAGAQVAITAGNTYAGQRWGTSFKLTDTVGSSAMFWAQEGVALTAVRDVLDSNYTIPSGSTSLATASQVPGFSVSILVTSATQLWLVEISIYMSLVAGGTVVADLTVDGVADATRGSLVTAASAAGAIGATACKTFLLSGLSVGAHTLGVKGWQPGGTGQILSGTSSSITAWTS